MNSVLYSEGDLVVGKLGNNPWWPGRVVRCAKSGVHVREEEGHLEVHVAFLEIGVEAWLGAGGVVQVSSRAQLEMYLSERRTVEAGEGDSARWGNSVPLAMEEAYRKAWRSYVGLNGDSRDCGDIREGQRCSGVSLEGCRESQKCCEDIMEGVDAELGALGTSITPLESLSESPLCGEVSVPCEVCVTKHIESRWGPTNNRLIEVVNSGESRETVMIKMAVGLDKDDNIIQCDNLCVWKYHRHCVTSEKDLVCSCNKSCWQCSVCDDNVPVTQLFLCNNHQCMRAYHKSCISAHLELQPDIKQCPLHQCINCRLDDLSPSSESPDVPLAYCLKCKVAFHNHRDCLPSAFLTISDRYIVCARHLIDLDSLRFFTAGFCFTCTSPFGSTSSSSKISCKYCPVTYHNTSHCVPSWLDIVEDGTAFTCNGCKFPFTHRSQCMMLAQTALADHSVLDMSSWLLGHCSWSADFKTCTFVERTHSNVSQQYNLPLSHILPINLQSIDHLLCFAVTKFNDMQVAIHKLSRLALDISSSLSLTRSYRRNTFLLHFSSLFSITDNFYRQHKQIDHGAALQGPKCVCTDCCSTTKCSNVAANTECTPDNCTSLSRCRNRRLQKRHYPRQKLVINSEGDEEDVGAHLVLEEAVVKDVLVMELLGEVIKSPSYGGEKLTTPVFFFSDFEVIDNSRFCGMSRFLRHSVLPNLVCKPWTVSGVRRLGLFSCCRIAANEPLTVDMSTMASLDSATLSYPRLVPWTGVKESPLRYSLLSEEDNVPTVIDLCSHDDDTTDDITIMSRRPLCCLCLKELDSQYCGQRTLVHCLCCFSVCHLQCVYDTLYGTNGHCCNMERDPQLLKYICSHCLNG